MYSMKLNKLSSRRFSNCRHDPAGVREWQSLICGEPAGIGGGGFVYYGPGRCLSKLAPKHLAGLSANCKVRDSDDVYYICFPGLPMAAPLDIPPLTVDLWDTHGRLTKDPWKKKDRSTGNHGTPVVHPRVTLGRPMALVAEKWATHAAAVSVRGRSVVVPLQNPWAIHGLVIETHEWSVGDTWVKIYSSFMRSRRSARDPWTPRRPVKPNHV